MRWRVARVVLSWRMDWRRNKVRRGGYEMARNSAQEAAALTRAAYADVARAHRIPKADLRDEAAALSAGVVVKRLPPGPRK